MQCKENQSNERFIGAIHSIINPLPDHLHVINSLNKNTMSDIAFDIVSIHCVKPTLSCLKTGFNHIQLILQYVIPIQQYIIC